jgi:D-alanyl-D-alanine carboxypeptidase
MAETCHPREHRVYEGVLTFKVMRAAIVLCLATVSCGPIMDERQSDGAARAEAYFTALTRASKTPGLEYLVVNATDILFEYEGGWADIRRQVPIDVATTMMAYSMSRTITAVAVLQLVEAGKVGLDDPIERYVSSPYSATVTVRQLISHTSGIPNGTPTRTLATGCSGRSSNGRAANRSRRT